MRQFVQGLNVKLQEALAAVQINTFIEVLKKAQRIEIARAQVKAFHVIKKVHLVETKGKNKRIYICHPLRWVEELGCENFGDIQGSYSERNPRWRRTTERCLTNRSNLNPSVML